MKLRNVAVLVAVAVTAVVATPSSQAPGTVKAKPGFDITRFSDAGHDWFETFHVTDTTPLRDALAGGRVAADTRVLVTETAAGPLALLTDQMAYHHIAQGRAGGREWMATF